MLERPVIAIVEDDPSILGALLDALNRRFGADYLVLPFLSARARSRSWRAARARARRSRSSSPTSGCRR